ncbi:hypothetical protein BDV95DRAFT_127262 [Massariosphaeria phaeospora]|uniref:Uncharacterized protein n=1 Tax=Massariosphaeria phaeospora TaxID=100035 RepID=A0A7C8I527_9PLEO|nr:hypothetical protein BDV95DRAFT_127262 [Massariosphaeria phaeospora]
MAVGERWPFRSHTIQIRHVRSHLHSSDKQLSRSCRDGNSVLAHVDHIQNFLKPDKVSLVSVSALKIAHRIQYWWWSLRHPLFVDMPRATWAQMLQGLRISDTSSLVLNNFDADTIPSGIDVPIQRIRLVDIGHLALIFGCTTVELDVMNRHFRAIGPTCIITTEDIPTFGKAVRFEGDIHTADHHTQPWKDSRRQVELAIHMVEGCLLVQNRFRFGENRSFKHLCEAIQARGQKSAWRRNVFQSWPTRSSHPTFVLEADQFESEWKLNHGFRPSLLESQAFANWQRSFGRKIPTIIALSASAVLPYTFCGFPVSSCLAKIVPCCQLLARQLIKDQEALQESDKVIYPIMASNFWASDNIQPGPGVRSAGESEGLSWLTGVFPNFAMGEEFYKERLHSKVSRIGPFTLPKVRAPVHPWMLTLLQDFEPCTWAIEVWEQDDISDSWKSSPSRMLWSQVRMLDLAIRLQIKRNNELVNCVGWQGSETSHVRLQSGDDAIDEAKSIVVALCESYHVDDAKHGFHPQRKQTPAPATVAQAPSPGAHDNPDPEPTPHFDEGTGPIPSDSFDQFPAKVKVKAHDMPVPMPVPSQTTSSQPPFQPWDLSEALTDNCDFYAHMDPAAAAREYGRLATMLKLRALFFVAFLMVGPDTSQVFTARGSNARVPMI